jgi:hypothetical protein
MQPVRYDRDECFQETLDVRTIGLVVQFDECEFRGSVNAASRLTLCYSNLSDVDMEIADWVGFELSGVDVLVLDLRQAGDSMSFQAAMQRGSGQVRNRRLQRIETVVER